VSESWDRTDREPFDMDVEDPPTDLQGTAEWHEARRGCFTASTFAALEYDKTEFKSGPRKGQPRPSPESRNAEIDRVVAELLTGLCTHEVKARALEWGREMEPLAVAAYEARTGQLVELVSFVRHPLYPFAGASPDFLVDEDGGGEVKCPISIAVHARTLREGLPPEHVAQIFGALWVTGRKFWDFISFNPNFPPHLQLYVQRVERDESAIKQIEADVLEAWAEVQTHLDRLDPQP
jgi:hypothetical protein